MPPTAVQPLPSDAAMHAPLPMTPIPQDQQEAAEVQELRKDVASLSQQLNAALAMLNSLSATAAAATESAQIVAAAAAAAKTANTATHAPALAAADAEDAPLDPPAPAAAEAEDAPLNPLPAPDAYGAVPAPQGQLGPLTNGIPYGYKENIAAGNTVGFRLFQYTSQKLLRRFQLEVTDPLLYSTDRRRLTQNCYGLYAWGKSQMQTMFSAFEQDTDEPGLGALQALRNFEEGVTDVWAPSSYAMTGLVVVGMTQDKDSAIACQIEDLLFIAVEKQDRIDDLIAQVRQTGMCDGMYDDGDQDDQLGDLSRFEYAAAGSSELWQKILWLIAAYLEGATDAQKEIAGAEAILAEQKQGNQLMQAYISGFKVSVRKLVRAGGAITQQRKIQLCLQGATAQAQDGFKDAIRMAKLNGTYTGQEHTEWSCFAIIMARVGKSIADAEDSEQFGAEAAQEDTGVQDQIDKAVRAALAAKNTEKKKHDTQQICNNWKHTGKCHYERCRFSHDDEPGSGAAGEQDEKFKDNGWTESMLAIKAVRTPGIQFMALAAVSWKSAGQAE